MNAEAYRIALHSLVRQRKFIFAVLLSLLPAAAAGLAMIDEAQSFRFDGGTHWGPLLTEMGAGVMLSAALPLMCLLLAGGMIADEAEERTLSYLLVRPVPRSTLYLSRALAVLTVAAPLAVLQVLGLWLMRWISYGAYAPAGHRLATSATETVSAVNLMWVMLPVLLGTALLATVFFCLVFGLVSVMSTRYHFFVNLGYLGFWEAMLGHIPLGGQRLTATHHLYSMLDHVDKTERVIFGVEPSHPAIGIVALLVLAALAGVASMLTVRFRDFHVTSAAT